jgi:hypothetical protein
MEKWPREFLADDVSEDFQCAMREYDLRAGPDLRISRMVPRRIDVPPLVEGVLKDTEEESGSRILLVAVITLGAVFVLLLLWKGD